MITRFLKITAVVATLFVGLCTAYAQDSTATAAPAAGGDVAKGETLFKNNCAQCHNTDGADLTGPGLKDLTKRRDLAWITKWVNNSSAVIASGDKYAVDLYTKYNKTQMTAFPSLVQADIQAIISYVDAQNVAVVPPVVVVVDGVPASSGESAGGNGNFFNIVLVALLVLMALVLFALLNILNLLSKQQGGEATTSSTSFVDNFVSGAKNVANHATIRSAVLWLFILLAGKATLDGMFSIGVHQGYAPKQPIAFSHKLHAGEYKINCAYCHTSVYKGKQSGIPSANICMNCHNAIKQASPEIQKIYTAIETNTPIEWVRVHNLPDLAYFNHAQHTNVAGVECKNCHGEIEKMEVVQQRSTLTMGWCIDCHRKTDVNAKGNAYYDKLIEMHNKTNTGSMKVENIGGLECSKCHY